MSIKQAQTQTHAFGSPTVTAPCAATGGHYFKMTTGALSPAALTAISQQQQQQQQQQQLLQQQQDVAIWVIREKLKELSKLP